ncbi:MAG: thioredoxin domain-containing protein [Spirochaetota bacterium]|nr:thioredoxin domain-containing protein [Spirochaetota bacterium]
MKLQNRLAQEKSPYLLQHKNNPVDWYPWGEEAFRRARELNRPVFLSIGYSTCHWCHVMEKESFEDSKVAEIMNQSFVSIKVDREERPDIDHIYMSVCQMITGHGGWPLTIILTPDKKPFFAGTYFPRDSGFGRPGMTQLLPQIANTWSAKQKDVLNSAEEITNHLKAINRIIPGEDLDESVFETAFQQFTSHYDTRYGGFGQRPKFPGPHNLIFLLRYYRRTGQLQALNMVEHTLKAMRRGGIYDHVGYGFHRYSTDESWFLPHFEKMLYDQAMLSISYLEAYQITSSEEYAQTAREVFDYVLRDMCSPEGAFYSAEDADSQGEEGLFYLWDWDELGSVLSDHEREIVSVVYGVWEAGNFREEATGRDTGLNILSHDPHVSWGELAEKLGLEQEELDEKLKTINQKLFQKRETRVRPLRDDKILSDWNGLMIAALALAGRVLDDPRYIRAAVQAMDFILKHMKTSDGRLLHRHRNGESGIHGLLDDYAFIIYALIELYQTSFDAKYLEEALSLTDIMVTDFQDRENGGFFLTGESETELISRPMEIYDGAIPSANSMIKMNLIRLARITGNPDLEAKAGEITKRFAGSVRQNPPSYSHFLSGLDMMMSPSVEIVVRAETDSDDLRNAIGKIQRTYHPNMVIVLIIDNSVLNLIPFAQSMIVKNGQPTFYVCQDHSCQEPVHDLDSVLGFLRKKT